MDIRDEDGEGTDVAGGQGLGGLFEAMAGHVPGASDLHGEIPVDVVSLLYVEVESTVDAHRDVRGAQTIQLLHLQGNCGQHVFIRWSLAAGWQRYCQRSPERRGFAGGNTPASGVGKLIVKKVKSDVKRVVIGHRKRYHIARLLLLVVCCQM